MAERMIYLDHAATTMVDPAVLDAMLPYLGGQYGNPSSIHTLGRAALSALDDAREIVAAVLGAGRKEIIFTGGGTEANNLAIKGVALEQQRRGRGKHLITSAVEHHAVLHACEYLQSFGFELTVLPVDGYGQISVEDVRAALRPDTVLVSVMHANNEVGTIQPIAEIGAICRQAQVPFHCDAVQAAGSLLLDVDALNVDLLTLAAHKFYGPKGVGVLYVRHGTTLLPQINGGGQERRRRAGTENVAGIVGLAEALQRAEQRREAYKAHCAVLRDRLAEGVLRAIPHTMLNGHPSERLPNNVNLSFDYVEAESVLLLLDQHGICASSGSACSSGSIEPSHVLTAMQVPGDRANGTVRFSLGKDTTAEEIDQVLAVLPEAIRRLREVSPLYRERELTVV